MAITIYLDAAFKRCGRSDTFNCIEWRCEFFDWSCCSKLVLSTEHGIIANTIDVAIVFLDSFDEILNVDIGFFRQLFKGVGFHLGTIVYIFKMRHIPPDGTLNLRSADMVKDILIKNYPVHASRLPH